MSDFPLKYIMSISLVCGFIVGVLVTIFFYPQVTSFTAWAATWFDGKHLVSFYMWFIKIFFS